MNTADFKDLLKAELIQPLHETLTKFDPDQPRDEKGRFGSGSGDAPGSNVPKEGGGKYSETARNASAAANSKTKDAASADKEQAAPNGDKVKQYLANDASETAHFNAMKSHERAQTAHLRAATNAAKQGDETLAGAHRAAAASHGQAAAEHWDKMVNASREQGAHFASMSEHQQEQARQARSARVQAELGA